MCRTLRPVVGRLFRIKLIQWNSAFSRSIFLLAEKSEGDAIFLVEFAPDSISTIFQILKCLTSLM